MRSETAHPPLRASLVLPLTIWERKLRIRFTDQRGTPATVVSAGKEKRCPGVQRPDRGGEVRRYLGILLSVVAGGLARGMHLTGTWDLVFELLPNTRIYSSDLTLNVGFASGWTIESESKIYSDMLLRYQNFYLSGRFGEFDVWGKIYFHAGEVRYQKVWLHAEAPLGAGMLRSSVTHWASADDYSSSDKDAFGTWPCVEVVAWQDAWKFMTREVQVTGPVMGYVYAGGALTLNIGVNFPDPDRFQIYIPAANVAAFEAVFGPAFWATWVGQSVCVRGTVKGYRYTSGGPNNGGYSVTEVSVTSPSVLGVGACAGVTVSAECPGTTIRWFESRNYVGQTVYVQGPVGSVTGPATYEGHANHYRVRIGGGGTVANRVEVIMPTNPGWSTAGTSYTNEVCVYGTISLMGGVAVILPPGLISTSGNPCCTGGGLLGIFLNGRFRYTLVPWTVTVDFGDCCNGFAFRQLSVAARGLPLCCGLTYDAAFAFTKTGFRSLALALTGFPLFCCGFTADVSISFTSDQKTVTFRLNWGGIRGWFEVYGDAVRNGDIWSGVVVYGALIYCWIGDVRLEAGTAFDREKTNSASSLSFRSGEWAYLGFAYKGSGCCGADPWFNADFWFGDGMFLFGLRRMRLALEVPILPGLVLFTRGMIDQSRVAPLEYWNIGWKLSF